MKKIFFRIKISFFKRKVFYEILIFIILFFMLFAACYINVVSKSIDSNIFSNYDLLVAIQSNYSGNYSGNKLDLYGNKVNEFFNLIKKLNDSNYVSYSDFSFSTNYKVPLYPLEYTDSQVNLLYIEKNLIEEERHKTLNILDYGIMSPNIKSTINSVPSDFYFEYAILTEGRYFSNDDFENMNNVCIIPYTAVLYNGDKIQEINIGDTLIISELLQSGNNFINKEYSFEVIGKYKTNDGTGIEYAGKSSFPIYILHNSFKEMIQSLYENIDKNNSEYLIDDLTSSKLLYMHPAYFKFENIQSLDLWMGNLKDYKYKFPYEYQYYTSIDKNYSVFANLITISFSFEYIAIMCFIVSIIGLIIIVIFEIHNREKEIGILLAIGETKLKIVLQFVIEKMIILFISACISLCMILLFKEIIMEYLIGIKEYEHLESLKLILYSSMDTNTFIKLILYTVLILVMTMITLYFGLCNKEVNSILKGDIHE